MFLRDPFCLSSGALALRRVIADQRAVPRRLPPHQWEAPVQVPPGGEEVVLHGAEAKVS